MANYCIGDLHGNANLFFKLIEKIDFCQQKDKLYILGDVIDGKYGGIKILKYLQQLGDSCTLIRGNHEDHFLYMKKAYNKFMFNQQYKDKMKLVLDVYSENLYEQIEKEFFIQSKKKGIYALETKKIKKWIVSGNIKVRKKLLVCIGELLEVIEYNQELYNNARWIWRNLRGSFNTLNFVRELFEQTTEEYNSLIDYLEKTSNKISIKINGKEIVMTHAVGLISENVKYSNFIMFPHANTDSVTYIFGHEPVPKIHRLISKAKGCCGFEFDYREVFSYCDDRNNNYYNLDLGSNPIVALCLDNMNEYYVGEQANRNNLNWKVPQDKILKNEENTISFIDYANFFDNSILKNIIIKKDMNDDFAFMTYNNGCYEFLIGIQNSKKKIYYTRVDLLDYLPAFVIDGWFCNQTINEIIEKVKEDYTIKRNSDKLKEIYQELLGRTI